MKRALLVLGLIVGVMAAVMVLRGGRELRPEASAEMAREHVAEARMATPLRPDAVLAISPRAPAPRAQPITPPSKQSPLMQEFHAAKAYQALYERLHGAQRRTAEETWVLAKMLDECAKVADRRVFAKPLLLGDADAKARFEASLSPKDPRRDKRIAAFDAVNVDRCMGLRDIPTTEKEIRGLLAEAASAGDPKASADLVRSDLVAQVKDPSGQLVFEPGRFPSMSDAQVETLRRSVESGDPDALVAAIETFGLPMANLTLRAGPDEGAVDTAALSNAARLVACDLGVPCGADSRFLLSACAWQGRCDAQSLREYLFYYGMSPETSQQVAQYQSALVRAMNAHDWSYFTFFRGPRPGLAPFMNRQAAARPAPGTQASPSRAA
jgi:hypothetical protein